MMLRTLESLPSRLSSTYMDIVDRLSGGNSDQFDIAMTLFALMLRAARSPTFQEIQVSLAVVQDEDGPDLEEALIDVDYILDCCSDLVVGNFETRTLSFSHYTVTEFLLGLDAVKQRIIPVTTLNDRFPGLFDPAFSIRNEDGRYHAVADTDDGESAYGSEVFSQFSKDETLVPSIRIGDSGKRFSMVPLRGTSVSEQLVKLFMADPALPGLVASALQRVGATGFERTFSILLKQYSKNLEITASKPSQKVAAVWIGHATRRTASLLRATVRPEDTEDNKLREAALEFDTSKVLAVNRWLAAQDGGLNLGRKGEIAFRNETPEPLAPVQLVKDEQYDLSDKSDDEDLNATYTNLDAVKVFMTGSEPYKELKSSLIKQTNHEDQAEDLLNRRMVLESEKPVRLLALQSDTAESHRIMVFTLISIFFIPLSFFTSTFGMIDMGPNIIPSYFAIMMYALIFVNAYIFVGPLNDGNKIERWMRTSRQNFWKEKLVLLSSVFYYKLKWGLKADKTPAFSPFTSINVRDQLPRLWLGILNWKGNFSNYLYVWKHGRRIDMTYFQWTCVSSNQVPKISVASVVLTNVLAMRKDLPRGSTGTSARRS